MGEQDTYAAHVVAYLESDPGRDTPPHVAARLMALGPGQMGMSTPPSPAQLHTTRQALEELEPVPETAPAPGLARCPYADGGDVTGVFARPDWAATVRAVRSA